MERELMPGMPLFIFSPICFLCPHPQLQCKTRVLLLDLPDPKFGTYTPGPVFHWRGNWGFCLPSDNTSHVVVWCCCTTAQSLLWPLWQGRWALRFAHDWLQCAQPDSSVLLWVYFALDELLFFIWQKPREYHHSSTHTSGKFPFPSQTSSWMKKFWLTQKFKHCCLQFL